MTLGNVHSLINERLQICLKIYQKMGVCEIMRVRERECVRVCMCVIERERERERERDRVRKKVINERS